MRTNAGLVGSSVPWISASRLLAARLVAEYLGLPLRATRRGERRGRNPLDEVILLEPVGDEVADCPYLQPVCPSEIHQVVETGHSAVLAQDSQITPDGLRPARARHIDRGLGMPSTDQHAAWPRDQRENVPGRDER